MLALAMALAIAGCVRSADDAPTAAAPVAETTTTAPPTSTTVPPTTTTAPRYGLLGEQVAVSESALGTVTWWHVPSIPLELVDAGGIPSPGQRWDHSLPALYENAQTVTGACFEIYEQAPGYLGLGPCPRAWALRDQDESGWNLPRRWWQADFSEWLWLTEVWFSPDGESWDRAPGAFPDTTAAVEARPWSVAERDGRWVVIGATGVTEDADVVPDEGDWSDVLGLRVRRSVRPAAWVSNDLATWAPLPVDFSKGGTNTHLTSVVAGEAGWAIFGIRSSEERPWLAEWVGWASTDGSRWEELPMTGVYDEPCRPVLSEHCGMIKAHLIDDAILVYAWTWPVPNRWWEGSEWQLFIGEL
jgi:hypothetical protein